MSAAASGIALIKDQRSEQPLTAWEFAYGFTQEVKASCMPEMNAKRSSLTPSLFAMDVDATTNMMPMSSRLTLGQSWPVSGGHYTAQMLQEVLLASRLTLRTLQRCPTQRYVPLGSFRNDAQASGGQ